MNWEYKVINVSDGWFSSLGSNLESDLNKFGTNGWELVSSIQMIKEKCNDGNDQIKVSEIGLIFKKPIK